MTMNRQQAYNLLGVNASTSPEDLKKAYRILASKYHPDKEPDESKKKQLEVKFKEIKEAFELLEKPAVKEWTAEEAISRMAEARRRNAGAFYNEQREIIQNLLVDITLEEAFTGTTKTFTLNNLHTMTVTFPPGIRDGESVKRIAEEHFLTVICARIKTDQIIDWGRYGATNLGDIRTDFYISPLKMILGGWQDFTTLDGGTVQVRIPPGLESNKLLKIKGKGYWKNQQCIDRGDVFLKVIPKIQKLEEIPAEELAEFIKAANELP